MAAGDGITQIRSYPSAHGGSSAQAGWEYVESLGLEREAPRVGEQAAALLRADACPAGRDDDRDRRRADGAAGARVGRPPDRARPRLRHRGRLRGHELPHAGRPRLAALRLRAHEHHRRLDHARAASAPSPSTTRACPPRASRSSRRACCAASSPRARPRRRSAAAAGGSMRADGWSRMPLVRMTNLHLEPGEGSLEELIADVDDGLYLETNKSWSIDDKRLNFQFGTQIAWEIKNGKLGRMLRDATYTGVDARSSGARSTRSPGREEWVLLRADELRQGPAGPARARLARRRRPPASATSQVGVRGVSDAPRARAERRSRRATGDEALALVAGRALRHRALRRLGGAPADADRERRSSELQRRPRRPARRRGHEPDRRRRARGARRRARRGRRQRAGRSRLPRLRAAGGAARRSRATTRRRPRSAPTTRRASPRRRSTRRSLDLYGFFTSGVDRARDRLDRRAGAPAGR